MREKQLTTSQTTQLQSHNRKRYLAVLNETTKLLDGENSTKRQCETSLALERDENGEWAKRWEASAVTVVYLSAINPKVL